MQSPLITHGEDISYMPAHAHVHQFMAPVEMTKITVCAKIGFAWCVAAQRVRCGMCAHDSGERCRVRQMQALPFKHAQLRFVLCLSCVRACICDVTCTHTAAEKKTSIG